MKWPFWSSGQAPAATSAQAPPPAKPKVWNPGWDVELFAQKGEARWCATATTFEVFQRGTPGQKYWERRVHVFTGTEVYVDQQAGPPLVDTKQRRDAVTNGDLVYFPPSGGEVYRQGIVYTVNVVASNLGPEDLAPDIVDVQAQLGGAESRFTQCRRALTAWAADPTAERTSALRESYYGTSSGARCYLMGMDAKDKGIRAFFEADDEENREFWRTLLLATCRTYADDFKV